MCQLGDPAYFIHITTLTAAKPHRCCECNSVIERGASHERVDAIWEHGSGWSHIRTCARCVEARRWLEVFCKSWLYEGVQEDLDEHAFEYGDWALGIVANAMQKKWYRKDGRLFTVAEIRKLVNHSLKTLETAVA